MLPEPMTTDKLLALACQLDAKAHQLREDAGYGGDMHDRGASVLLEQVECFRAGLAGRLPICWKAYADEAVRKEANDRSEYARLKKKYEGERP